MRRRIAVFLTTVLAAGSLTFTAAVCAHPPSAAKLFAGSTWAGLMIMTGHLVGLASVTPDVFYGLSCNRVSAYPTDGPAPGCDPV